MNKTEEIKLESTEKVTKVEEVNPLQREKKEKLESLLTDSGGNDFTEKKKGRGRPKSVTKKSDLEDKDKEKKKIEMSAIADIVIDSMNKFFLEKKLSVIHPAQSILIRTGLIGCGTKYNLSIDDYPELTLLSGIGWLGVEKIQEIKKINSGKTVKEKMVK